MAWNPLDHHRLAIANSIGEIKCFNFPSSSNTPSNQPSPSVGSGSGGVGGSGGMMQLEWSGEKASTSINRLAWSPHDASILATGSGDGSIKFYDIRASKNTASQTYRQKGPIASPCRDLKFNLKDSSIFASASDSGRLHIWDKRWTQRALMTFEAHKRPVLTIAWNPSSEWIIASGSADRTVKVWDTGKCDLHSGSSHLTAAMTSSGINPMTMTPVITDVDPLLTQTIYTSGEVSRLLWNPTEQSSTSSNSSYSQHILTMSGSVGADHNAGYISLWDLQRPHIPIVSLRGHGNDACTMIDWIDCKRSSDLLEFQVGKGVISAKLKRAAGGGNSPITPGTSASPSKMKAVTSTDPKATSINSSNSINNGSGMLGERREAVTRLTVPWVLSSGKSTILIESLKYGFFPYNHLSPVVASLSSQGHLAFQHAQVRKMEEPPKTLPHASGLKNQKITSNHSSQGRKSDTTASSDGSRASSRSASPTPSLAGGGGDGGLGKVFFGFADFGDLAEAEKVRAKGGAEATVFDPALIHLLATHYYVPQLPPPPRYASDVDLEVEIEGEQKNTSAIAVTSPLSFDYNYLVLCYDIAVTSCRKNFAVASAAGLNCRASVWASLEALLPYPQDIGTNAASDTPEVVFSDDLPFTTEVISTLLSELLEGGDAQHFVVMCEILRCAQILPRILQSAQIPARRTRSIYVAYIDLLMRLELFAQANQIVKSSDDEEIAAMSRKDVEIKIQCGGCKKSELRRKDVRVGAATVYCQTCKACVSRCSLCDLPVTGLLQWCPICGHGGHLSCLKKWFALYTCCPTGCGHQCCVSLYQPDDSATSSAPQQHHRSRENGAEEVLEEEVEDDIDKLLHRRRQSLKNMRRKQLTQRFS